MSLYDDIQISIKKALEWLKIQQNLDGSWGQSSDPKKQYTIQVGVTGLVLLKFETYALEIGFPSPFDERYIYKDVVEKGLNYLFKQAKQDLNGIFFQDIKDPELYHINYSTGIALAAICANAQPDKIVTSSNSVVNGKTYKQVAQSIVDYLSWSQNDQYGGWSYYKEHNCPDNSNTGYVVLGLDFAKSKQYKFMCNVNSNVTDKLKYWISIIQNVDGGSKYSPCGGPVVVNILKTGNLLEEMYFCGYPLEDTRVQKAMTYIANNWDAPFCASFCAGWNGNPADYQGEFTTMKGLSEYDVKTIVSSSGQSINWFEEMAAVIVDQQNADGSWNFSGQDTSVISSQPILSTAWAVLKLERAIPTECNGNLVISKEGCKCIACIGEKIPYTIKLENTGPGNCYNIIVTDIIPLGAYVNSVKVSRGNVLETNGQVIWSIPELDAGEAVTAMIVIVATENVCFNNGGNIINICEVTSCSGITVKNVNDTVITYIDCFSCDCCKKK